MRPVSAGFLRSLRGSHVMFARARVVTSFTTGTNPAGTEIPILAGDVVHDASADVRATLDLTTDGTPGVGPGWPRKASDLLTPYGNELFIERGVQFGNGTREFVSQGYFRLYTPEQEQAPDGPIRIAGRDRMSAIVDARLLAPRQFAAGTTVGTIMTALVTEVYPAASIEYDDGTTTSSSVIGRALIAEEDRYGFLNDLITSRGKIWYFDHRGVLVIKSPPSATSPVFDISHGRDGVLVAMSRSLSREGVFNAVVATGEGADTIAPARAVAIDNNPHSPTYWYGRFGKVPRFYSSPFITTNTQAFNAASSILRQSLGLPYNVSFGAVPNPALEPFDPVRVVYPTRSRSGSGYSETHILDRLTVPLVADAAMTADTREQHVVTIGNL